MFRFDGSDQMPAAVGLGRLLEAGDGLDHRPGHEEHARQDRGRLAEVLTGRLSAGPAAAPAQRSESPDGRPSGAGACRLHRGHPPDRLSLRGGGSDAQRSTSSARCSSPSGSSSPSSAVVLFIVGRFGRTRRDRAVAIAFVGPAAVMLSIGLHLPRRPHDLPVVQERRRHVLRSASTTTRRSSPTTDELIVLRNTAIWVLIVPFVATAHRPGLRHPGRQGHGRGVRQGADLPADGDLVRRRLDHLEVRLRLPARRRPTQIGLLNQILVWLGVDAAAVAAQRAAGTPSS